MDVSPEIYARLYAILARDERSRSARFRIESDQRRFVVSHGILRELLARYLQIEPDQIRYEYNAFGKPDLGSEFGGNLKFNLSHSGGLALIAVASGANVGIDLEYIRAQPSDMEIARLFFSKDDVDHLRSFPSHLRSQAFFRYWTRTEAYVKASGEGLANLDGVSDDISPARYWSLYDLRPAPGYVGALAIKERCCRLVQRDWQISVDGLL